MVSEKYSTVDSCSGSPSSSTECLLWHQNLQADAFHSEAANDESSTVFVPYLLSETLSVLRHVVLTSESSDASLLNALDSAMKPRHSWRPSLQKRVEPIRGFTIEKFVKVGPGHYVPAITATAGGAPTQVEKPHRIRQSSRGDHLNIKVAARPKCITCHGDITEPISEGFWSLSSCSLASDRETKLIQKMPTIADSTDEPYILHALLLKELTKQEARGDGKVVKIGEDKWSIYMIYPAESRRNSLRYMHPIYFAAMGREELKRITSPTEAMQRTWRESSIYPSKA